jgi:dedicator of cytokinesis protein 3
MPWQPLPAVAYAICTYPFHATQPQDLPLQVGDHIYIIEQGGKNQQWYRGYLVAAPSLLAGLTGNRGQQLEHRVFSGIFPRNCVEVREFLGENKSNVSATSSTSPISPGNTDEDNIREKRKSQKILARRLSRAHSRKRSQSNIRERAKAQGVDLERNPLPRAPNAPKPLAPVPLLRVGDETVQSAEEPLVDEIASCLREWHDARLHELLLARGYDQLSRVQELIKRLGMSRQQLMHDVMTTKELKRLREDTVWDLVAGNKLLSDEVVVRSCEEKGRMLTADDSVIEMTKDQANMSILDRPPNPPADIHMLYHILVDVTNFVSSSDQPATLQMYLCSKQPGEKPRPLTENYSISVPVIDAESKPSDDEPKTLFANLTAADLGVGQEATSLYLVFKLLRDEPVRQTLSSQPVPELSTQPSISSIPKSRTSLKSRRSMFGSQKKQEGRPGTANSERPRTGRSSSSLSEHPSVQDKTVKRTVGVGAIDIGRVAREHSELRTTVAMWVPSTPSESPNDDGAEWDDIIRELGRSPTGGYTRVSTIKRFDVFTTTLPSLDLDSLIRTTPTLLHNIHPTQKLGFSGVPSKPRSDIYLTITEPLIPKNAQLAHSKFGSVPLNQRCQTALANLQLTLEVRKGGGERVEDCIFTSSNHQGHIAWRTTGVERGEAWNQTIRLSVPTEDVPGCHVVMSIADSPNFPFALAWVPLWENDAFVRDGEHHVSLYVYDEYSSSLIGGKGAYLALPPWAKKADFTHQSATMVSLRTYLCSTEYSQDPNLLGLLNWREFHGEKLVEILDKFSFVPEIEIVKLLGKVFQALFEILDEYNNSDVYEDLIFSNFVVLFLVARDRRFDMKNVIEEYATTRHDWPNASQSLIRAFYRLLTNPMDMESSRKLRAALKVGDQVLRLIVETRIPPSEEDDTDIEDANARHPTFVQDLQDLFVALMALMRNPMPVLLGTQTLVIQHFHSWLPELASFMSPTEILEIATNLLDACAHAQGKLIFHRLVLIINFSQLEVFKQPEIRETFVANTYRWLAPYWGATTDVTTQWRTQVRLCCSVIATQMFQLGEESCQYVPKLVESYDALHKLERVPKRTFSMLFPTSFPFPERRTPADTSIDEGMLEMSALLAAALATRKRLYFDASVVDVPGVLLQALKVSQSILDCEAFPRSWVSLHVSHHRFSIDSLQRISEILLEWIPDIYAPNADEAFEFDTNIWRQFFETLFAAVSSPALAMETFPEQKRRAIWKIAGDVREQGAQLLKRSWEAIGWETDEESRNLHGFERMGGYQVQFVPDLVGPIVELCLSVHASLRSVATQILRSMIVSAWELDQDLSIIQTAMIDCLDKLCRRHNVSEALLHKTFITEMMSQFAPLKNSVEDSLYQAVIVMFSKIEDLLGMLGNVHSGDSVSSEPAQIVNTLRLMEFLRNVQSEDAYVRYVHQLSSMQSNAGNHTEAGLALQLHADRYQWDTSAQVNELKELELPSQNAFDRKEALYVQMVQHFELGKCWQKVLSVYKELAVQYENNVFDFAKLARAQRAMASVHEKIAKNERAFPRYFRVVYRGHGFPVSLRDKEFIFEGHSTDRLATFEDRMKQLHPAAQLLRVGTEPELEGQYLQIFAVSVHKDLNHTIYQRTRVAQTIRDYYLLSSPQKFSTTSRQPVRDVPITDQPVEKIVYTTMEAFPTILRRTEIVKTEMSMLSPVEAALERTARKTQEMIALEKRVVNADSAAMNQLSEAILLSVDPNSDSSVARYRSLLPAAATDDTTSEEVDPNAVDFDVAEKPAMDVLQSALHTALLDHTLVIRRCLSLYNRSAHAATRAQLVPRFEASFERELAVLFPGQQNVMDSTDVSAPDVVSPSPDDQQAVDGAAANESAIVEDGQQPESAFRRGRRRSLSFLKRGSISSIRGRLAEQGQQTNGTADESGRQSRQESRGRHRSQSRGRLSLFERRPSMDSRPGSAAGNHTPTLKKRLSFLSNGGKWSNATHNNGR